MQIAIIIPAYMPDKILINVVKDLNELDFSVLVIDDGSGEEYSDIFASCEKYAKIIHHDRNMGKGVALRTGFSSIRSIYPDCEGVITVDADGQHSVVDICNVAEALENGASCVITERSLGKNIPFRSKFGNDLSRFVYAVTTGRYLYDNQSGLRGFEISHCDWLVNIKGDKYDYEMGVLLYIDKANFQITKLPIRTIYNDSNSSSHFNPVKDTIRIYGRFIDDLWFSFAAYILNFAGVIVFLNVFSESSFAKIITICGFASTFYSVLFNKLSAYKKMSKFIMLKMTLLSLLRMLFSLILCIIAYASGFPVTAAFIISLILLLPLQFFVPYFLSKLKN